DVPVHHAGGGGHLGRGCLDQRQPDRRVLPDGPLHEQLLQPEPGGHQHRHVFIHRRELVMTTPLPPAPKLEHSGRPREEDILTRKRMSWWDHAKWLVLLTVVWCVLVLSLMGDNPLVGSVDALRLQVHMALWVFIIAGV